MIERERGGVWSQEVSMHVFVYICIYIYIYTSTQTCLCTSLCVCECGSVRVFVCAYVHSLVLPKQQCARREGGTDNYEL